LRYTNVLVAISADKPNRATLQSARAFAVLFDISVTGVAVCPSPQIAYDDSFGHDYGALIQSDMTRFVVGGSYDYSRLRERVLGGVSEISYLNPTALPCSRIRSLKP
jgi:hypothetical protein